MRQPAKSTLPDTMPLHVYLRQRMKQLPDLTNVMVAQALGYERSNVVAMLRQGTMKLPASKVPDLARMLEVDPAALMRRTLQEYDPTLLQVIETTLGTAATLSNNEIALIKFVRQHLADHDVALTSDPALEGELAELLCRALERHLAELLAVRRTDTPVRDGTAKANREWLTLLRRQATERSELRRSLK